jgi:hypothetical protein
MKIISHILSLFLSGIKSEDIYLELIFITPAFKAGWVVLIAFLSQIAKTFTSRCYQQRSLATHRLSLCHGGY